MAEMLELVVAGSKDTIRAFVSGFLAGEGLPDDSVLFASDNCIETESAIQKFAELVHLKENHVFLLAEASVADDLAAKIVANGRPLQMAIRSRRLVESASLRFSYDAFNRELGAKLDQIVRELAAGLRLSDDYKPELNLEVDAVGPELYSPVHDIEIHAEGQFSGALLDIIAARTRLLAEEMVQLEPIQLHYA